jgi:hypothetical protein
MIAALTASTGDVTGGKCNTAKNRRLSLPSIGDNLVRLHRMVFSRRDAKAAYCKARGDNQYEREEAFAIELFDAADPSN